MANLMRRLHSATRLSRFFILGVGSAIDLWPNRGIHLGDLGDDTRHIEQDWKRVGADLRRGAARAARRSGTQ